MHCLKDLTNVYILITIAKININIISITLEDHQWFQKHISKASEAEGTSLGNSNHLSHFVPVCLVFSAVSLKGGAWSLGRTQGAAVMTGCQVSQTQNTFTYQDRPSYRIKVVCLFGLSTAFEDCTKKKICLVEMKKVIDHL